MDVAQILRRFFAGPSTLAIPAPEGSQAPPIDVRANVIDVSKHMGRAIPVYPDPGAPVPPIPPVQLLETQRVLVNKIHQASTLSHKDFNELIYPALVNYAAYVHLLPASESHHHSDLGGLLRHGLEVCFNAALACEGKIFAFDHWASRRDKLVPRWRVCAFLGGLLHDMGKPMIDVGAHADGAPIDWNPHSGALYDWLVENRIDGYRVHWRPGPRFKRHGMFNSLAVYRIIPKRTLDWIGEDGGQEALDAMVMVLAGGSDPNNPLYSIITEADSNSTARDLRDSRQRLAAQGLGAARNVANMIVRSIHDLVLDGTIVINKIGSPVWHTDQGLFFVYPAAITTAVDHLRAAGEDSMPADITKCLELLHQNGYLHAQTTPTGASYLTWKVTLHANDRGRDLTFTVHVIRIARDDIIPPNLLPPIVARAELLGTDGKPVSFGTITPATTPQPAGPAPNQASPPTPASSQPPAAAPAPAGQASSDSDPAPSPSASPAATAAPPRAPQGSKRAQRNKDASATEPAPVPDPSLSTPPSDPNLQPGADLMVHTASMQELAEASRPAEDQALGLTLSEGSGDGLLFSTMLTEDPSSADPQAHGGLRHRGEEPDVRDQQLAESYQVVNRTFPPANLEGSRAYLLSKGAAGTALLHTLTRFKDTTLSIKDNVMLIDERIHLRFPNAFDGCGIEPIDLASLMRAEAWLVVDRKTPNVATVLVPQPNGQRQPYLRFTADMTDVIAHFLPPREAPAPVALGHYIDDVFASKLQHPSSKISQAHIAVIRFAFRSYADDRVIEEQISNPSFALADLHVGKTIEAFIKSHSQHTALNPDHVLSCLAKQPNPVLRAPDPTKHRDLVFNNGYDPNLDAATISKSEPAR